MIWLILAALVIWSMGALFVGAFMKGASDRRRERLETERDARNSLAGMTPIEQLPRPAPLRVPVVEHGRVECVTVDLPWDLSPRDVVGEDDPTVPFVIGGES